MHACSIVQLAAPVKMQHLNVGQCRSDTGQHASVSGRSALTPRQGRLPQRSRLNQLPLFKSHGVARCENSSSRPPSARRRKLSLSRGTSSSNSTSLEWTGRQGGTGQLMPSQTQSRSSSFFSSSASQQQLWLQTPAAFSSGSSSALSSVHFDDAAAKRAADRSTRLELLVELRRIYRNCLRAVVLLSYASPVYQPPASGSADESESESDDGADDPTVKELELQEKVKAAVEVIAEMQLVAEQLKASLRALPSDCGAAWGKRDPESDQKLRSTCQQYISQLKVRYKAELALLPFSSELAAQAAVDARNMRYTRRSALDNSLPIGSTTSVDSPAQQYSEDASNGVSSSSSSSSNYSSNGVGSSSGSSSIWPSSALSSPTSQPSRPTPIERLELAEKVAERFVAKKIKPALRRASEKELGDLLKETGSYLQGFWNRLNGGGQRSSRDTVASMDLPVPVATKRESELAIGAIGLELESLEKKLQEASKVRENKLRKAGIAGRVQMAIQLKLLDAEVLNLSSVLAVRTLQLEMEYIYRSLEDEALDVVGSYQQELLSRDGSTSELALLVAEFELLNEQLTVLAAAAESSTLSLVNDGVLEALAVEIPDMCKRVGVGSQQVFGGQGFSLTKTQLQLAESRGKLTEAINFLVRGLRLLASDAQNSVRLVSKAALGNSLKPREVAAIRRTGLDVLTFIPFTIILIVPLTPLGHVLIFGFIQRYFPSLFPSQFTSRRQEIMVRYEELQRQLLQAQATAEQAEDEAELARAAAVVARLTAPGASPDDLAALAPDARKARTINALKAHRASIDEEVVTSEVSDEAARQVRILEQALDEIREDVHADVAVEPKDGVLEGAEGAAAGTGGGGTMRVSRQLRQ